MTEISAEALAQALCDAMPHPGGGSRLVYEDALEAAQKALVAVARAPEYVVIRDSAGAPLFAIEVEPIPKPEVVDPLALSEGTRVAYYRDDSLVGSVVEVEARRTRAGEPISVYAVLWDEEIRPSKWYAHSDLKAL